MTTSRPPLLVLALAQLSGCALTLDWDRPSPADVVLFDAPSPGDAPELDVVESSDGAVDTGRVDTGPGTTTNCGEEREACCAFGRCDTDLVCVLPSMRCEPCGGNNQRCCADGRCQGGRLCTTRFGSTACRECGGTGELCCANRMCDGMRRCNSFGYCF